MPLLRLSAVLLLAIALTACTLKDETNTAPDAGPPPIPAPADVAAPPADAIKTESGLAYKVLTVGLGRIYPTRRSSVTAHYTGWTADGKMFQSSYQSGKPLQFEVTGVIPGWTEVLLLMVAGEKVRVWIPAKLAYAGMPDRPQGMLVFEIELLDVK